MSSRLRGRWLLAVVAVAVLAVGAGTLAHRAGIGPFVDAQGINRFAHSPQYVDPASSAATWAEGVAADDPARVLATTPTGIWLTPEQHPTAEVGDYVTSLVEKAAAAGSVPLLVIYGIPQRDCSGELSSGGTTVDAYLPWVQAIATAAGAAGRAVTVLEPDALATAESCGLREERVQLIRGAIGALADAHVTTYVDAGHSSWVDPDDIAALLREVGVDRVRGFATNVSNFQTDEDELVYATKLVAQLPGTHYVVDTGRNGNGSTDDWCNPTGRALGPQPGFVDDGTPLDALLWIKPPGESDGTCGGGPAAGLFWPQRAEELVAAAS